MVKELKKLMLYLPTIYFYIIMTENMCIMNSILLICLFKMYI